MGIQISEVSKTTRRPRSQFLAPFAMLVPRFWGPKWVAGRLGPDVAEIGPLLRGFGPKPGCAEIAAVRTSRFFLKIRIPGNPDFLKKYGQISSSAETPVFGAIRLASASVLGPEMGLRPARPRRRRNRAPFTGIRPGTGLRGNRGRTSRFFLKSGFWEIRIS